MRNEPNPSLPAGPALTLGCLLVVYGPAPGLLLGDGLAVQVYDAGAWHAYTRADGASSM